MGDAEKPELTKQFNEGYKTDLAEPGEAPGGKDEISEVKLWTPLRGGLPVGVGRADTGGNAGSVGDKFAFGNTEERARLANMGCKQRGFRGQRAFDHTTGQGYVKSQRGHYDDGIFTKRNKFNLPASPRDIRRRLLAASSCKDQPPRAQGSTLGR